MELVSKKINKSFIITYQHIIYHLRPQDVSRDKRTMRLFPFSGDMSKRKSPTSQEVHRRCGKWFTYSVLGLWMSLRCVWHLWGAIKRKQKKQMKKKQLPFNHKFPREIILKETLICQLKTAISCSWCQVQPQCQTISIISPSALGLNNIQRLPHQWTVSN